MIDYSPLWETMKQRHISQYALINKGIDKHTLDQLRKNQNITVLTVEKLCNILILCPSFAMRTVNSSTTISIPPWRLGIVLCPRTAILSGEVLFFLLFITSSYYIYNLSIITFCGLNSFYRNQATIISSHRSIFSKNYHYCFKQYFYI